MNEEAAEPTRHRSMENATRCVGQEKFLWLLERKVVRLAMCEQHLDVDGFSHVVRWMDACSINASIRSARMVELVIRAVIAAASLATGPQCNGDEVTQRREQKKNERRITSRHNRQSASPPRGK